MCITQLCTGPTKPKDKTFLTTTSVNSTCPLVRRDMEDKSFGSDITLDGRRLEPFSTTAAFYVCIDNVEGSTVSLRSAATQETWQSVARQQSWNEFHAFPRQLPQNDTVLQAYLRHPCTAPGYNTPEHKYPISTESFIPNRWLGAILTVADIHLDSLCSKWSAVSSTNWSAWHTLAVSLLLFQHQGAFYKLLIPYSAGFVCSEITDFMP